MKFVLVHGGWQGGWCWDAVADLLRSRGHEVIAPTLYGLSAGENRPTLSSLANGLIKELVSREWHDLVLVGHSGGGPVVQLAAEALGPDIRQLVFLSAWVLVNGESINDVRPAESVAVARLKASRSADSTVRMDPDVWAERFMQDAGPRQLRESTAKLVPLPFGWLDEKIALGRFAALEIPTSYIHLSDDRAAPRESFRRMASRLSRATVLECAGSHQAMLTRPRDVVEALLAATAPPFLLPQDGKSRPADSD